MTAMHRDFSVCVRTDGRLGVLLLAVVLLGNWGVWSASAEIVDSHVLRFEAVPSFINLNMTTSIEVEIGTSYGFGLDNYRATVTTPAGTTAVAWYNFAGLGSLAVVYGDAGAGFATVVDQVGLYDLRLDYFDGTTYSVAAYAQFQATDRLVVVTEAATASNEYTDVHNCPIAQEFQRGGEVVARAYVTYASTGGFVNGTATPSARGNITGTLFGLTKNLAWQNVYHFWRAAWFPTWNESIGVIVFTASASDGRGNIGSAVSPPFGLTAWKIIPAILKVVPQIVNDTGAETVSFVRGDNLTVRVRVTYEGHNAHNRAFPGPMNGTRGGVVTAVLGYGAYNVSSGLFADTLTTLTLSLDPATRNWSATYQIRATDPVRSDLRIVLRANDGASPPNTGSAFTTQFAIQAVAEPPTPPPTPAAGLDPILAIGGAIAALAAGLGIGAAVFRRRKASAAPAKVAKEAAEEEKASEDEWVVEGEEGKP